MSEGGIKDFWHVFQLVLFISGAELSMNLMSIQNEQDIKGKTDAPLLTDPPFYLPEF